MIASLGNLASSCLNTLKSHLLKFRILTLLLIALIQILNSVILPLQDKLPSVTAFITSFSLFMNSTSSCALLLYGLFSICLKKLSTNAV